MDRSIIIIGAGTAGLSAGCYAQMNGYRTRIYEMHTKPGGLCTSWSREGYLFDGSVAGLAGSAPGNPLYRLWEEIGVAKYCPLHFGEHFAHIHHPDGRVVTVHANVDTLEKHLTGLFPSESKAIQDLINAIRSVLYLDPPFRYAQGLAAWRQASASGVSYIRHMPAIIRYGRLTVRDFSQKFSEPFLISVFTSLTHFGGQDIPLLSILLPLAYAHRKMAGIPAKGWLSFAKAIERRFTDLGGTIYYNSKVERLIVENGTARGIILSDGTRQTADIVLSAADGHFSNFRLLGRQENTENSPFKPERLSDQPVQVNLGVAEDLSEIDAPVTYLLPTSFDAAGKEHEKITMYTKYYDPEAAPKGKSAVTVFLDSHYSWWQNISGASSQYQTEKRKAAEQVINAISYYRPGFDKKVELIDVATPLTRERYTGNWMGAMQGWQPSRNLMSALLNKRPQYSFKGVSGFFVAGHWVEAWGGVTTAAQSGRRAISEICKHDGKRFTTTVP